jgi:hypothetical protein
METQSFPDIFQSVTLSEKGTLGMFSCGLAFIANRQRELRSRKIHFNGDATPFKAARNTVTDSIFN